MSRSRFLSGACLLKAGIASGTVLTQFYVSLVDISQDDCYSSSRFRETNAIETSRKRPEITRPRLPQRSTVKEKTMSATPFDQRDGWIWYDGQLVPWKDAKLHVLTH